MKRSEKSADTAYRYRKTVEFNAVPTEERRSPRRSGQTLALLIGSVIIAWLANARAQADVTVAFTGDQGTNRDARKVLNLIAEEGTDLLLVQGDLGYHRGTSRWMKNIDQALGEDFPVLAVVGNHEENYWAEYQSWLGDRIERLDELACQGEIGVKAHCTFRGLSIVQVAPGIREVRGVSPDNDYAGYITRELSGGDDRWRICSWHKLQHDMQIGGKKDETGWAVYEACREAGGIVATAHDHSYSRTYLMSDFEHHEVVHRDKHLEISPGHSFAFVSGLGGKNVKEQRTDGDWWAARYSATQGAAPGALFCTFSEQRASCWFKDIEDVVPDRFTLERTVSTDVPGKPET